MAKSAETALDPKFSNTLQTAVPEAVTGWPSMMTAPELRLLFQLAADYFTGAGVIVDAGIFLGASTHAFAQGLLRNGHVLPEGALIYSYDNAVWVGSMDRYLTLPAVQRMFAGSSISAGDSFASVLRAGLQGLGQRVELRIDDIVRAAHTDRPVEIAFYDCLKDARRDLAVFNAFGPHYIPGHSLILQQDYFYEGGAHHKLRQELYADCYDWIGRVGSTAVFRLRRALPETGFQRDQVSDLTVSARIELMRQASGRADGEKERLLVELSLLEHLIEIGARDTAVEIAEMLAPQIMAADLSVVTRRPSQVFARLQGRLGGW